MAKLKATAALLGCILLLVALPADAVIYTWNTGTGNWSVAGNWSPAGGPPVAGDDALIDNGGTSQVSAAAQADGIAAGFTATGSGTLQMLAGGSLTTEALNVGFDGAGTFDHTAGTVNVVDPLGTGVLYVGRNAGSDGDYTLSDGTLNVGDGGGGGGGAAYVGDAGEGFFTQSGAFTGHFIDDNLHISRQSGSAGEYLLSDGQCIVGADGSGDLYIGEQGNTDGTLENTGGALVVNGHVYAGEQNTARGEMILSGGSTVVQGHLYAGRLAGATGIVNLDAPHSLSVGNNMYVGDQGTGVVNHASGSNGVANTLYVGNQAGSLGVYNLSGGTLSASTVQVGTGGTGVFNIYNTAATVNLNTLDIGQGATLWAAYGSAINFVGANAELEVRLVDSFDQIGAAFRSLTFHFTGTGGLVETPSKDFGQRIEGYELVQTHMFDQLILDPGADIALNNTYNNNSTSGGTEAIYVRNLVLGDAATVNRNGLNFYVWIGNWDPAFSSWGALPFWVIPEPTTLVLFGGGLVAVVRRRRKAR